MPSFLTQPDARTCQSTCIAMALDQTEDDIHDVRSALEAIGEPGDPAVMGEYLRAKLGDRYNFEIAASINDMIGWLKNGEFLITHGWFTDSGHVIGLNGVEPDQKTLGIRFKVYDPWSEFNFTDWAYDNDSIGFQGAYSAKGIYAAAIVGNSKQDAEMVYSQTGLDINRAGAWIHRIRKN